ncbi:hypothetical protein K1719_031187 [Acacia pycnantha]|nr:hypothetical protein K1719_031187 [Acacia pycnantha]
MGATDVIASVKESQAHCNLTKGKSLYMLNAAQPQSQLLRVEEVRNCQQNCQLLFSFVSRVVKVGQVLELISPCLLLWRAKFVGIFTLTGWLLAVMEIC